jgi:hypothetical protein
MLLRSSFESSISCFLFNLLDGGRVVGVEKKLEILPLPLSLCLSSFADLPVCPKRAEHKT